MKKIFNVLLILGIVGTIVGFFIFQKSTLTTQKNKITVTQTVSNKKSTYVVQSNKTALQLLQEHHKVKTNGAGKDAFVIVIDDIIAHTSKKEFWSFYVNNTPSEVGAGSYILKNNDSIKWKIEIF